MITAIWLLYLADVVSSISVVCAITIGAGALFCGFYSLFGSIENDEFVAPPRAVMIAIAVAAVVGALTPSKTTIYAAAAVYAGDKALQTQTGGKAVQALNAWLDRQIASDGKEGEGK